MTTPLRAHLGHMTTPIRAHLGHMTTPIRAHPGHMTTPFRAHLGRMTSTVLPISHVTYLRCLLKVSGSVVHEECVDEAKQLHDSLVLTQVLVAFQEEHEVSTIAACVCDNQTSIP